VGTAEKVFKVKGQGYNEIKCTFTAEAYISTVLRSGSLVMPGHQRISYLSNWFIGTPRICNFLLLLTVWVRYFSKMLHSVKLAEDKVLVFVILREKC